MLAAGYGSRLNTIGSSKPLVELAGRPIVLHVLNGLAEAGISSAIVVVGHHAADIETAIAEWSLPMPIVTAYTDPALPNGVSVLAAAPRMKGRCLLTMADHIVQPTLYRRLISAQASEGELLLGVDRRIGHPWIDEDDVTRVRTSGDRITAIGKLLADYNGYDTGVFSIDGGLIEALSGLDAPSLSAGVARLADAGLARAVESGDCDWIDIDDPHALNIAERWFAGSAAKVPA